MAFVDDDSNVLRRILVIVRKIRIGIKKEDDEKVWVPFLFYDILHKYRTQCMGFNSKVWFQRERTLTLNINLSLTPKYGGTGPNSVIVCVLFSMITTLIKM